MKNQVSSFRRKMLIGAGIITASLAFSACHKFDDNTQTDTHIAALMTFNLATDKPAVIFRLSGTSLTNMPLAYSSFTGTYLSIFPGNRAVEATDNNGWSVTSPDYAFAPDKFYSAFLVGANNTYQNVIVQDNFDSLKAITGQAYIRYINAIPDSSKPNVKISASGTDVVNGQAGFANVSEFKSIAAGAVTIDINNGGTITANRTITLEAKKVYTVLLIGTPGASSNGVEIRYIANGMLDETSGQRVSGAAQSVKGN